ncbi:hypothetical protein ACHAWF_006396, partial [Thalassiosira exigua]
SPPSLSPPPSSSSSSSGPGSLLLRLLPISPDAISLLPLAQRLVSIEVQDDHRELEASKEGGGGGGSGGGGFVDRAWDVLCEPYYQKMKGDAGATAEAKAEPEEPAEARRRSKKRRKERRTRPRGEDDDALAELGVRRVRLLERYVRPALLPPNDPRRGLDRPLFAHFRRDGPRRSGHYDPFVKWLRGEYLVAKYGPTVRRAVSRHPELRDDPMGLSNMEVPEDLAEAPLILPSAKVVREAFRMRGWSDVKVPCASWGDEEDRLDGNESDNRNGRDRSDGEGPTFESLLHAGLRGQISHSGPLNAYFELRRREDSYELWTKEYVFGLAKYLLDRVAELDGADEEPTETVVLDVGAGDGRLAYFVRRAMREIVRKSPSKTRRKAPEIVATDDGSWPAPIYDNSHITVERLSAVEALEKYGAGKGSEGVGERSEEGIGDAEAGEGGARRGSPATPKRRLMVLCSWMPPGEDWTSDFRRVGRAEEYVLVGEADDGSCGHNWFTWGNPDFRGPGEDVGIPGEAPHLADGYERVDLGELTKFQFSRFDCKRSRESMTVSFRRRRSR